MTETTDVTPALGSAGPNDGVGDVQTVPTTLPRRKVLLSKSKQGDSAPIAEIIIDPVAEASQVANDWHGSVESLILACARIKNALGTFGKDKALLAAFLAALVDGHVLSSSEAQLGRGGPKLSKLLKIGEHADLLRRDEIFPFLLPGYTVLYQAVVLYEKLPGLSKKQKIRSLARSLESCPGELSREYLSSETQRVKHARSAGKEPTAQMAGEPATGLTLGQLLEVGQKFDRLLLTPSKRDLVLLRGDYADGSTLERCLPLFQLIEHNAAAVIAARISDLPVIADVLLPRCGFPRLSRVFLARLPTSSDVTDAEIIVTAERGDMRLNRPDDGTWLVTDADPTNPIAIAERLYSDAPRKVHVFASKQSDGWHCLVGDDSWTELPSLR